MSVCFNCGVEVAESKSRGWVHVEAIPKGVDPDHPIVVVGPAEFVAVDTARADLRMAANDMLTHHGQFHPHHGCPFSENLERALRS